MDQQTFGTEEYETCRTSQNYMIDYTVESDIASQQTPQVSTLCTSFVCKLPCNGLKE